ncbi:MAG TPA: hypothetical protein VKV21_02785 [Solirubrobacteraceae bacterium]|nr:hypothetical protein [Solirubrobacteraceae bacterium]
MGDPVWSQQPHIAARMLMTPPRRLYDYTPNSGWTVLGPLDEISVLSPTGLPLLTARVPKITRRFASPMHVRRILSHGPDLWESQLLAFIAGNVPTVRLWQTRRASSDGAELRDSVVYAMEHGTPGTLFVDVDGYVSGTLALPNRIADTIDLDALNADYLNWFTAAGIPASDADYAALNIFHQLDDTITELSDARYADYLVDDRRTEPEGLVSQSIRTGILFGDDPGVTCASILERLSGDRRLWEFTHLPPTPRRPSRR